MRHLSPLLSLVMFAGIAFVWHLGQEKAADNRIEARVEFVKDGDSLRLIGQSRDIRLWGIDAPEMGEPAGRAARDFMKSLVTGQSLRCQTKAIDKYGRKVAQCWRGEDDLSLLMLQAGQAKEFCSFTRGFYGYC